MISHLLISLIDSEMSLIIGKVFRSSKFLFKNYCFVIVFILNDFSFSDLSIFETLRVLFIC